jgi:hypothetical protein
MHDFRTPVMTWVEASWEDQAGTLQTAPARMEDKSLGGACIRVKTPIGAGSKLRIQWRFERFSGTAKYCRSEGNEYVVGIQRDTTQSPIPERPAAMNVPPPGRVRGSDPPVLTARIENVPKRHESEPREIPVAASEVERVPGLHIESEDAAPQRWAADEIENRASPRISQPRKFDAISRTELQTKRLPKAKEPGKERKSMARKWFDLTPRRNQEEGLAVGSAGDGEARGDGNGNSDKNGEKENFMAQVIPPTRKAPAPSAREVPTFQVELSPMEDIYRMAGIMIPRKGYSIKKIVEMTNSEHIRGLSKEMKRAAVLMALDAAGISVEQIQQDAKARQDALDSYEAAQKKQIEAEWARKAEEVVQIQAEMESIKAHYMARISRNMEGVAREKSTFSSWQSLKQDETQSMSEALELCLKSPVSEPASAPPAEGGVVKVSATTV